MGQWEFPGIWVGMRDKGTDESNPGEVLGRNSQQESGWECREMFGVGISGWGVGSRIFLRIGWELDLGMSWEGAGSQIILGRGWELDLRLSHPDPGLLGLKIWELDPGFLGLSHPGLGFGSRIILGKVWEGQLGSSGLSHPGLGFSRIILRKGWELDLGLLVSPWIWDYSENGLGIGSGTVGNGWDLDLGSSGLFHPGLGLSRIILGKVWEGSGIIFGKGWELILGLSTSWDLLRAHPCKIPPSPNPKPQTPNPKPQSVIPGVVPRRSTRRCWSCARTAGGGRGRARGSASRGSRRTPSGGSAPPRTAGTCWGSNRGPPGVGTPGFHGE